MTPLSLQWLEPAITDIPAELLQVVDGQAFLAELLARRGWDAAKARLLLDPAAYTPAPPADLPDLACAADRLEAAIRSDQCIGVWGDFDADGQTATTLLVSALRRLGAQVQFYIPIRGRESHGIHPNSLRTFLAQGVQLLLTCDTGVTAHEAVQLAAAAGVDTIITDHHGLPLQLPAAIAVVNPQRLEDPNHPLFPLCGVGVAYKLAQELYLRVGRENELAQEMDLVALGTVADLAQLTGDNRALVIAGLQRLRQASRPAIQAMLDQAGVEVPRLNEEDIGFIIAPRLNALGRLADANPVVDFLTTPDPAQARLFAAQLEGLNSRRKLLCDQVFDAVRSQIDRDHSLLDSPVLVLSHTDWPAGVIGIVASRLVGLYHRPTILFSAPPGQPARGSARSVEGIHITRAIAASADLMLGFGGHPMAAGLSIDPQRLPEFRRALARTVQEMSAGQPLVADLPIDAWLPLTQISLELVEKLDRLAPFGPGHPPFTFATRQVTLRSHTAIGRTRDHLQLMVEEPGEMPRKVLWWQGAGLPLPDGPFDLAYQIRASNFRGQPEVQVEWIAARQQGETVELRSAPRWNIEDLRQETDLPAILNGLLEDSTVWYEGINPPAVPGVDRLRLAPAHTLVILNSPPGSAELRQALATVTPRRIILCAGENGLDKLFSFLERLGGLIHFTINKKQGQTTVVQLAASTAQREPTVRAGLDWLTARGEITVQFIADGQIHLERGGKADPATADRIEIQLKALWSETAAYRAFYLRADPQDLLE